LKPIWAFRLLRHGTLISNGASTAPRSRAIDYSKYICS
jgi:hypothetical protein